MDNEVIVSIGKIPYTTTVQYGKHQITVDEPEDVGGEDQGINPTPLLLSSLGSCKAITVKMYADRKTGPWKKCWCVYLMRCKQVNSSKRLIYNALLALKEI